MITSMSANILTYSATDREEAQFCQLKRAAGKDLVNLIRAIIVLGNGVSNLGGLLPKVGSDIIV